MYGSDHYSENKYLFSFFVVLLILIFTVYCVTVISALPTEENNYDSASGYASFSENISDIPAPEATEDIAEETIVFPLSGNITSLFSYRINPFYDPASGDPPTYEFHRGIDISAALSQNIMACSDGIVIFVGSNESYGNYIMIEHERYISLYAHCSSVCCEVGEAVSAGESIAVAGSTGRSTGPHLHFEIRVDGDCVNPLDYVGCVYTGAAY